MITRRQAALLAFVRDYAAAYDGATPSYREIADALGLHSKSRVSALVDRLVERGYLHRIPRQARSLEVIDHSLSSLAMFQAAVARLVDEQGPVATATLLVERAQGVAQATLPAAEPPTAPEVSATSAAEEPGA